MMDRQASGSHLFADSIISMRVHRFQLKRGRGARWRQSLRHFQQICVRQSPPACRSGDTRWKSWLPCMIIRWRFTPVLLHHRRLSRRPSFPIYPLSSIDPPRFLQRLTRSPAKQPTHPHLLPFTVYPNSGASPLRFSCIFKLAVRGNL